MAKHSARQFTESGVAPDAPRRASGPGGMLRRIADGLSALRRDERTSAEMTTLPPPSRGQALREAHRTLRARMKSHPAIRQVLPHLSAVERALAKRGSRALAAMPVPVLRRALEQLAVLQRDDESPAEAMNLRVLRLRLIEAIAMRGAGTHDEDLRHPRLPASAAGASASPSSVPLADGASLHDSSDLSSSAFDEAEQAWNPQPRREPRQR